MYRWTPQAPLLSPEGGIYRTEEQGPPAFHTQASGEGTSRDTHPSNADVAAEDVHIQFQTRRVGIPSFLSCVHRSSGNAVEGKAEYYPPKGTYEGVAAQLRRALTAACDPQ